MCNVRVLHNSRFCASARTMFLDGEPSERIHATGFFWFVESQGQLIAIDTGIGQPGGRKQTIHGYTVEEGHDTTSLLDQAGLAPQDFEAVILTHLHWDHCLNLPLFENAEIFVSARELDHVLRPRHDALATDPPFPRAVVDYMLADIKRLHLVGDELEITPDVRAFWVGGHTPGSQAVAVATSIGTVTICGDIVARYENIDQDRAIGLYYSLPECYEGMGRIRSLQGIALPSHDPTVRHRWVGDQIG